MSPVRPAHKLTHQGALDILAAAVNEAGRIGVPQCIAVVDEGCNLLAFVRMDGGRVLSIESATRKAMTAATSGKPTTAVTPGERAVGLALATGGRMTGLKGGLPLLVDGIPVGGIGVGSGTGDQDEAVASAGVAAFEAALRAG